MGLGNPRFDVDGGVFDREAVVDEGIVFGHEERGAVGDDERPVDQFLESAPVHAQEGGIAVDTLHVWILKGVDGEQILPRRPGTAVADNNVKIPHEERILAPSAPM